MKSRLFFYGAVLVALMAFDAAPTEAAPCPLPSSSPQSSLSATQSTASATPALKAEAPDTAAPSSTDLARWMAVSYNAGNGGSGVVGNGKHLAEVNAQYSLAQKITANLMLFEPAQDAIVTSRANALQDAGKLDETLGKRYTCSLCSTVRTVDIEKTFAPCKSSELTGVDFAPTLGDGTLVTQSVIPAAEFAASIESPRYAGNPFDFSVAYAHSFIKPVASDDGFFAASYSQGDLFLSLVDVDAQHTGPYDKQLSATDHANDTLVEGAYKLGHGPYKYVTLVHAGTQYLPQGQTWSIVQTLVPVAPSPSPEAFAVGVGWRARGAAFQPLDTSADPYVGTQGADVHGKYYGPPGAGLAAPSALELEATRLSDALPRLENVSATLTYPVSTTLNVKGNASRGAEANSAAARGQGLYLPGFSATGRSLLGISQSGESLAFDNSAQAAKGFVTTASLGYVNQTNIKCQNTACKQKHVNNLTYAFAEAFNNAFVYLRSQPTTLADSFSPLGEELAAVGTPAFGNVVQQNVDQIAWNLATGVQFFGGPKLSKQARPLCGSLIALASNQVSTPGIVSTTDQINESAFIEVIFPNPNVPRVNGSSGSVDVGFLAGATRTIYREPGKAPMNLFEFKLTVGGGHGFSALLHKDCTSST